MIIDPSEMKIEKIFSSDKSEVRYKVPIYQRKYSWKTDNIYDLFNDIKTEDSGYYIGNLIVISNEEKTKYEIVDGQQRLITISLFLLAIYDLMSDSLKLNTHLKMLQTNSDIDGKREILEFLKRNSSDIKYDPKMKLDEVNELFDSDYVRIKYEDACSEVKKELDESDDIKIGDIPKLKGSIGFENDVKEICKRLLSGRTKILDNGKLERSPETTPVLELLKDDMKLYEDKFSILYGEEPKEKGNVTLIQRYKYIKELINSNFNTSKDTYNNLKHMEEFYDAVNNVTVIRISMNDLGDAFSVFSSLNSKGLPLNLIDLLKSCFIKETSKSIDDNSSKWDEGLIEIFKKDSKPDDSEATRFLLNNYDTFESQTNSSITKNKAFKKYEPIFHKDNKYIDTLIEHAKIFSIIAPNLKTKFPDNLTLNELSKITTLGKEDSIISKISALGTLDATTAYPLMMVLLNNLRLEKNDEMKEKIKITICKVFDYLIKFYVRRNIVQTPKSSNIRTKILTIVHSCNELDESNKYGDNGYVAKTIAELDSISATENSFKESLQSDVYKISRNTTRYLLICLERSLQLKSKDPYFDKKQRPDNLDDKLDDGKPVWTIEHIMPQSENLTDKWYGMIDKEFNPNETNERKKDDQKEHAIEIHNKYLHRLGNLTLSGYNANMGKTDFENKITMENGLKTKLCLNQSIPDKSDFNKAGNDWNMKEWTIKDINRRTKLLSKKVIELFPLDKDKEKNDAIESE